MKIAFIVGQFPVLSQTFVLNQITGLLDRGHEVYIYTKHQGDWESAHPDVARYQLQQRTFQYRDVPASYVRRVARGLWLLIANFHRAPRLILRSLNVWEFGPQVVRLWLFYAAISLIDLPATCDVIHCQFGTYGYQGRMLQLLLRPRPKLLLMFRGYDISSYVRQKGTDIYRDLFQVADACLANCDFFRQRVIQLGCPPEKVAVHYSGLDLAKFTYKPRLPDADGSIRLLTTGRLVEKKGIEYAIRAVALLAPRYPQLQYSIVGDGPLRSSLQTVIDELHLGDTVRLLGWQREQELIETLDRAHLFIAPSVTAADGDRDAPVNVLKEAMAMGLPVVSTTHGGIPELVQPGVSGYLAPERDAPALADCLEKLLSQPQRWPEMGQAGRAYVAQHFNLEALNDLLVARYEELLAPPKLQTSASTRTGAFGQTSSSLPPSPVTPNLRS